MTADREPQTEADQAFNRWAPKWGDQTPTHKLREAWHAAWAEARADAARERDEAHAFGFREGYRLAEERAAREAQPEARCGKCGNVGPHANRIDCLNSQPDPRVEALPTYYPWGGEEGAFLRYADVVAALATPAPPPAGISTATLIDTTGAPVTFRHHDHEIDEPCAPTPARIDVEPDHPFEHDTPPDRCWCGNPRSRSGHAPAPTTYCEARDEGTLGLREALEHQSRDENLSPSFRKGIAFAAGYVGAWIEAPDDDHVKRRFRAEALARLAPQPTADPE